ncbi:hypothetical protein [uncultured Bacteroides sp.]|uniref:DNA primase n=2 Tax=Bacteroides ovatus TaxID=28116 RepID=A0A1G8AFI3_BACOV|nr:hypothetical protein [uncultured Bacteroides sp.]SDH19606.1 hypothetical protein SAMN05192582_1002158 [Bacteroides ovatus]
MNIEQAKRIKLEKFLMKLGMEPVEANGNHLWYHSPFRKEEVPSFIVDVNNNVWFDHGTDKGGNIIALAKQLYQTDIMPLLMEKIEEVAPAVPPTKFDVLSLTELEESVKCVTIEGLKSIKDIAYFSSRNIDFAIADKYCKQISFRFNDRDCQAVAFPNIHGGYELRSNMYSGHMLPLAISIVRMDPNVIASSCCVFTDFIDFLSYKTLLSHGETEILVERFADTYILNSASLISKALPNLNAYSHIYCYLNNDKTGRTITETIQGAFTDRQVVDASDRYADFQNVSTYLQKKSWRKR